MSNACESLSGEEGYGRLSIPIAVGTEVLVELSDLDLRFKSTLVGMEQGRYLIVKVTHNEIAGHFRDESVTSSPVVIRYLYRGSVYGFGTSVLNAVSKPARLFFLAYPEKVEEQNIRTDERYGCILSSELSLPEGSVEMMLVDISRGGCRCMVKTAGSDKPEGLFTELNMNKEIRFKVRLPGLDAEVDLEGCIRNINKDQERLSFGVRFKDLAQGAKSNLDKFISIVSAVMNEERSA